MCGRQAVARACCDRQSGSARHGVRASADRTRSSGTHLPGDSLVTGLVADADERAAEIADVGTREPQTGLLILNLLPSGAAVGDDDRRADPWLRAPSAAGLRTRARERPARGRRGSPRARRRRIVTRAAAPRDISPAIPPRRDRRQYRPARCRHAGRPPQTAKAPSRPRYVRQR
jgi:hypothetical protein